MTALAPIAEGVRPNLIGTIEAKDFSFWYGKKQALRNITMAIPPRAVTALIGPSGCGKSTFLRSINRLNELIPGIRHEGDLCLDGNSVFDQSLDVVALRQRVGMVFQRWNPFPKSIYENIAYGPRINGLGNQAALDEIVERSLRRAALWDEVKDRLRSSALSLSGGQQQRVCIARALVSYSMSRRAPSILAQPNVSKSFSMSSNGS